MVYNKLKCRSTASAQLSAYAHWLQTPRQSPQTANDSCESVQRQTDIRTQVTCHPHGRVFLMCYSQPYEGTFGTTNFSYVWTTKTKNHQGPLNFSKNIVSLVHRGAYCAWVVHIATSWCTSTPYTVVVVYNVPWVHPCRQTCRHTVPKISPPPVMPMAKMDPHEVLIKT